MSDALMRWLQLPLSVKAGTLIASALLLMLTGWFLLLRPQQQAQQKLQQRLAGLQLKTRQYQFQLHQQPALSALLQQQQQTEAQLALLKAKAGTLETLLADRGGQLASWQPDAEPKQLALRLSWDEFQPLFSQLQMLRPTPLPARFLLQAEQDRLLAQLWLEISDEE